MIEQVKQSIFNGVDKNLINKFKHKKIKRMITMTNRKK